ncbi:Flavin-containing monooxygenase 5 [Halotydeus destructor]|nr:Flavin-containing monooxygenase 5 [Halotydeus destructor]
MSPRVAVIGAGVSGLTAVKASLEQGLSVTCFEKSGNLGGLWYYDDGDNPSRTSVMKCTLMNSSKEMSAFSDYPPPEHYPLFMTRELAQEYILSYASHFGLDKYVKLNCEVSNLTESSNGWTVTVQSGDEEWTEHFEAVLVATGLRHAMNIPKLMGIEQFKGTIVHSSHYRTNEGYSDKNVLIVGFGASAADVAADLAGVAKSINLSHRTVPWITPRTVLGGHAYDSYLINRFSMSLISVFPKCIRNAIMRKYFRLVVDPERFGMKPSSAPLENAPLITDTLIYQLISKTLLLKSEIAEVKAASVIFKSGEEVEVDCILFCTGFDIKCPFIKDDALTKNIIDEHNQIGLFKNLIPHNVKIPGSLMFLGLVVVMGPQWTPLEMQSRFAASVISGKIKVPARDEMQSALDQKRVDMKRLYKSGKPSKTYLIQEYIEYMDWFAEQLGCKPNIKRYMLTDPKLFRAIVFGPFTAAQYRLSGPQSWPEARDAILGVDERERKSFYWQ